MRVCVMWIWRQSVSRCLVRARAIFFVFRLCCVDVSTLVLLSSGATRSPGAIVALSSPLLSDLAPFLVLSRYVHVHVLGGGNRRPMFRAPWACCSSCPSTRASWGASACFRYCCIVLSFSWYSCSVLSQNMLWVCMPRGGGSRSALPCCVVGEIMSPPSG